MTLTKEQLICRLENMLQREQSRLWRVIISVLLLAIGLAYFLITWHVYGDESPAATSEMYTWVPMCFFTPLGLTIKAALFVLCGVTMLVNALDKSREVMLTALLETLRSNNNNP
jgi:hypothetical protein